MQGTGSLISAEDDSL